MRLLTAVVAGFVLSVPSGVVGKSADRALLVSASEPVPSPDAGRGGETFRAALPPRPSPSPSPVSEVLSVDSTAYCLTGTTASGETVREGMVAMNDIDFGTRFRVLSGPLAGQVLVVADRIGANSQFDVAMPGQCERALLYGRKQILVQRVP